MRSAAVAWDLQFLREVDAKLVRTIAASCAVCIDREHAYFVNLE